VNALAADAAPPVSEQFCTRRLERVFAQCFWQEYQTRLLGGAPEPLYQPGSGSQYHRLYYREDYFSSALHEVAHWCIAGSERRKQLDFGYWYAPDGRDQRAQKAFEAVEIKPQALEWHFSRACGYRFCISLDNLEGSANAQPQFSAAVLAQAQNWERAGLPVRGQRFIKALRLEFETPEPRPFSLDELG